MIPRAIKRIYKECVDVVVAQVYAVFYKEKSGS